MGSGITVVSTPNGLAASGAGSPKGFAGLPKVYATPTGLGITAVSTPIGLAASGAGSPKGLAGISLGTP